MLAHLKMSHQSKQEVQTIRRSAKPKLVQPALNTQQRATESRKAQD